LIDGASFLVQRQAGRGDAHRCPHYGESFLTAAKLCEIERSRLDLRGRAERIECRAG
jgi:hypothetical protein